MEPLSSSNHASYRHIRHMWTWANVKALLKTTIFSHLTEKVRFSLSCSVPSFPNAFETPPSLSASGYFMSRSCLT